MNTFQETSPISNIVTPPDVIDRQSLKFLLIDVTVDQLLQAQLLVSSVPFAADLYVYGAQSDESDWLDTVAERADTILINYQAPGHRLIKQAFKMDQRTVALDDDQSIAEHIARLIHERKGTQ